MTRPPIDLALDGTPHNEALIIDGERLVPDDAGEDHYDRLSVVFHRLCKMRDELQTLRNSNIELIGKLGAIIESIPRRGGA
jgi:hypothetical protein